MKYGALFLGLGSVVTVQALTLGGPSWVLLWPGISFSVVGLAYLGLGPRVFGKSDSGSMAWYCVVLLLPYLLLTWSTWYLVRFVSCEDCFNEVATGLFVGRRPLAGEVPEQVKLVVDLAAEFPATREVREGREYIAAPLLDAGIGPEREFALLVRRIADFPDPVYIHCAQGHGRTGTVAAAVLVAKGCCSTVEDAVLLLRSVRPGLDLGKGQMTFARRMCEHLATSTPIRDTA